MLRLKKLQSLYIQDGLGLAARELTQWTSPRRLGHTLHKQATLSSRNGAMPFTGAMANGKAPYQSSIPDMATVTIPPGQYLLR